MEDLLLVCLKKRVALGVILEEKQLSLHLLLLYPLNRMSMLVTPILFVSSAKMQLEVLSSMITGRLSRQGIVRQHWLELINQLLMLMS